MPLPASSLARGTVEIAGETVNIRSLTRAEALQLAALKDDPERDKRGEVLLIACGTETPPEEAEAWWSAADPAHVAKLIRAITVVSRLAAEEDGPDPKRPSSGS